MNITCLMRSASLLLMLLLAGCGGGGGGSTTGSSGGGGGGGTYSASSYFAKTTMGNTWTSTGTENVTGTGTFPGQFSYAVSTTNAITAVSSGTATWSSATTRDGSPYSSNISTTNLDSSGNLISTDISVPSASMILLPATFSAGTTWTALPASGVQSASTGTILGVGVACSSSNQTYNDCVEVKFSSSSSQTIGSSSISGTTDVTDYISPTVGYFVQESITSNFTQTGTNPGTRLDTKNLTLQAGFIAN